VRHQRVDRLGLVQEARDRVAVFGKSALADDRGLDADRDAPGAEDGCQPAFHLGDDAGGHRRGRVRLPVEVGCLEHDASVGFRPDVADGGRDHAADRDRKRNGTRLEGGGRRIRPVRRDERYRQAEPVRDELTPAAGADHHAVDVEGGQARPLDLDVVTVRPDGPDLGPKLGFGPGRARGVDQRVIEQPRQHVALTGEERDRRGVIGYAHRRLTAARPFEVHPLGRVAERPQLRDVLLHRGRVRRIGGVLEVPDREMPPPQRSEPRGERRVFRHSGHVQPVVSGLPLPVRVQPRERDAGRPVRAVVPVQQPHPSAPDRQLPGDRRPDNASPDNGDARLLRHVGRTSVSAGSIAAISPGSLVMTACLRSLAQMATLTSTMSVDPLDAHRAPTRRASLASRATIDVTLSCSSFAILTCRAPPRHAWATTPAGTANSALVAIACSMSTAMRGLPASTAINAPVSRVKPVTAQRQARGGPMPGPLPSARPIAHRSPR
jgi:hypothetical protein